MSIILITSILLRVAALVVSVRLAARMRAGSMLFLSGMLSLMAIRQTMTLLSHGSAPASTEVPGLVVSVLALLAVYGLGRLLREKQRNEEALVSSEAHYRGLIESSIDGTVVLDRDGRVIYANPEVSLQFGYTRSQLEGEMLLELVAPDDRERVAQVFAESLEAPGCSKEVACGMLRKDGSRREMDTRGVRVDREGEVRVLLSLRDVTDQRQAERSQALLQSQLYHAQKMETLGRMAGGIAHDFNNLLTPILGSAELARKRVDDEAVHAHLDRIRDATARARELVQRMLLVARKAPTRAEPVDLGTAVDEVLALLEVSLPARVEVQRHSSAAPCIVSADALQLQQVLMNLGTNAGHAMPAGGVLRIGVEPLEADAALIARHPCLGSGEWIHLSVKDTGVGMAPDVVARIFEPFYSTREPGAGSGLGLSVVRGIVEAHGGVAEVCSEPGQGTVVSIYLPRASGTPRPAPRRQEVETPLEPAGGIRLMLIDDEPAVLAVGTQLLEEAGYQVSAFGDPLEALTSFEGAPDAFAAVVTDHSMPGMTGLQVAKRIRALRPLTPVILTTGYAEREIDAASGSTPVREVLRKPFGARQLAEALARALRGRPQADLQASASSSGASGVAQ